MFKNGFKFAAGFVAFHMVLGGIAAVASALIEKGLESLVPDDASTLTEPTVKDDNA